MLGPGAYKEAVGSLYARTFDRAVRLATDFLTRQQLVLSASKAGISDAAIDSVDTVVESMLKNPRLYAARLQDPSFDKDFYSMVLHEAKRMRPGLYAGADKIQASSGRSSDTLNRRLVQAQGE